LIIAIDVLANPRELMSRRLASVALPARASSYDAALQSNTREQRLTVNAGSGQHRLAAWREALGATATIEIDAAIVATFEGEFRTRVIGPLMAVRLCSHTFRFLRSEEMARQIKRDNVFINLFESGRMVGNSNGRQVSVGPGEVILSRHGNTQDLDIQDATWFGLILPMEFVDTHMRWTRGHEGKVFGAATTEAVLLGHLMRSMMELPDPLSDRDAKRIVGLTIAHLTACFGTQAHSAASGKKAKSVDAGVVRRFLAEHIGEPQLGPDVVCKRFSLSRSSLYRMFNESGGIQSMILAMRLRAVHRDIASGRFPDQPLSTIAERRGVTDIRSFRRVFVKEYGYTPSDLRTRSAHDPSLTDWSHAEATADIERWFHT
jgi:AraC-like DNA-binding protein